MTDVAIPQDIAIREGQQSAVVAHSGHDSAVARLADWAQTAAAIHSLAERIVRTQFVPQAYRGKPDEAAAAMLAGAEVGISPMASLRAFHNINGTPAPAAITLRAVVQSHGHEVRIEESDDQHAVVIGRRRGETTWQTSTWTVERAQQAGYVQKNPNWRSNPAAMLVARATAEVCRWIASDAIMGMPYTAEEIRDQGTTVEARPAPRLVSAADFIEQPAVEAKPTPYGVDEALEDIAGAVNQTQLDEIRAACAASGIRDQEVRDAWSARSAQFAEAA
ncbi:hypothetical protein ACN27B_08535 [Micromonospora sp. WMMD754]|uniref:hypothetical protein n=1 Tax=Micromonospora sp. WMMD754 TaxID=3404114 RepID=UPI003BF51D5C